VGDEGGVGDRGGRGGLMHAKEGRVSIYLFVGGKMLFFHFLAFHMISSILVFCYTKFCLFWFFLGMIYFPNF
jgi:hypothetical protein